MDYSQTFIDAEALGEKNEGGWCNISGDAGGETYKGIARIPNPNWDGWPLIDAWIAQNGTPPYNHIFTENEIPGLEAKVQAFYKAEFWDEMHGDNWADTNASKYFYDWFLTSKTVATKKLQGLLNITTDGIFGNGTMTSVNNYSGTTPLIQLLHESRDDFYLGHVAAVPNDQKFLAGWMSRSDNLYLQLTA